MSTQGVEIVRSKPIKYEPLRDESLFKARFNERLVVGIAKAIFRQGANTEYLGKKLDDLSLWAHGEAAKGNSWRKEAEPINSVRVFSPWFGMQKRLRTGQVVPVDTRLQVAPGSPNFRQPIVHVEKRVIYGAPDQITREEVYQGPEITWLRRAESPNVGIPTTDGWHNIDISNETDAYALDSVMAINSAHDLLCA
jgi:hypothetical protein